LLTAFVEFAHDLIWCKIYNKLNLSPKNLVFEFFSQDSPPMILHRFR